MQEGEETIEGRCFKVGISCPTEIELWRNFTDKKGSGRNGFSVDSAFLFAFSYK